VGAVGLSPASAGAVTLGSSHLDPAQTDFRAACGSPPEGCIEVQKRLPGARVRAPFSGEVRKWRATFPPGGTDFQLVVLHKKPNGKFKNVGESSVGSMSEEGEFEFSADMPIHKGDYVGLRGTVTMGILNAKAKALYFDPPVEFADARKPSSKNVNELQFNATVRH
jgi:hypothetical protein